MDGEALAEDMGSAEVVVDGTEEDSPGSVDVTESVDIIVPQPVNVATRRTTQRPREILFTRESYQSQHRVDLINSRNSTT